MNERLELRTLPHAEAKALDILPAGPVDVRRDLFRFMEYVRAKGLVRTKRGNNIPKSAARDLAKLLSYTEEAAAVAKDGYGFWSDHVSQVARVLGLVSFDTKGEYLGYSSAEPSFPDNEIQIVEKEWRKYMGQSAIEKESLLLRAHLELASNEFFHTATLVDGERFDSFGSGTGPAGKMKLLEIRRLLLARLASLEADVWYETSSLVEWLEEHAPTFLLDPADREPDADSRKRLNDWKWQLRDPSGKKPGALKPPVSFEDLYRNFREFPPGEGRFKGEGKKLSSMTPGAFHRVEGRYLEYFLSEVPYLCGFVALGWRRKGDRHGLDVSPSFERLRAFRLTPRFLQILCGDTAFNHVKVTVLPNFDVLVEAPSYPDATLATLLPYAVLIAEDGPIHRLRLERRRVVETAAQDPKARPLVEVLREMVATPVPENVVSELASWAGHGEKVIFYEGFGLIEVLADGEERHAIVRELGKLARSDAPEGFVLVSDGPSAFRKLEETLHVPVRVKHRDESFVPSGGRLAVAAVSDGIPKPQGRAARAAVAVRLEAEDLVGYRASDAQLLTALAEALQGQAKTCVLSGDLLVVSAAALPRLRAALKKLKDRFAVTLGDLPT